MLVLVVVVLACVCIILCAVCVREVVLACVLCRFDRVFGADARQEEVFNSVARGTINK